MVASVRSGPPTVGHRRVGGTDGFAASFSGARGMRLPDGLQETERAKRDLRAGGLVPSI
jgi:hypothetical protein